jgi:hypothetical protein
MRRRAPIMTMTMKTGHWKMTYNRSRIMTTLMIRITQASLEVALAWGTKAMSIKARHRMMEEAAQGLSMLDSESKGDKRQWVRAHLAGKKMMMMTHLITY